MNELVHLNILAQMSNCGARAGSGQRNTPETLEFLPQQLERLGLIGKKELPDDWEQREERKRRIQ